MPLIPEVDVQEFFKRINLSYNLTHFELPEPSYENGNISFFETVIICLLCKNVFPVNVLEFGTFNGRTTINIAANIPENGNVITVDLPKSKLKNTKYKLEGVNEKDEHDELGYVGKTTKLYMRHDRYRSKIKQFWMDTADFPAEEYESTFGFIFVDASHTYENCKNDTHTALKCVKDYGFILWHDYAGWPGVTQALDEIYSKLTPNKQSRWIHIKGTSMVLYHENYC